MRVVVFGCGDPVRGDDGAARAALAGLPPSAGRRATLREVTELGVDDLLALEPDTRLIVVDAVVGAEPGSLVRVDLEDLPRLAAQVRPRSTHELPLDQVVGMAQVLGDTVRGTFLGIGGTDFGIGQPLSQPVWSGLPALSLAIADEIEGLGARVPALAST
jgi:hydrogenase maturation protease